MNKKGFTLVELIPVVLILSLAMISVGMVAKFGMETNKRQNLQNEVQENVRRAMGDVADNVRKGTDFVNYDGKTNDELSENFKEMHLLYQPGESVYDITSSEAYQGVLFIRQINGRSCLYALKEGNLYRYDFSVARTDDIFDEETSTESRIDKNTRGYYYDNYRFDGGSESSFRFYQGSRYFQCREVGGLINIYELKKKDRSLADEGVERVASYLETVTVTELADAYRIGFTVSRENHLTGLLIKRTLETSVARVNYGGDEDED
ncbi:prepilin-type N-terminal cleavage/methylation domain-containing protein [Anoxybacterium hadale]|uniref:Prepilin-type N-terminal cleavage/methylation domain-containing protein n=1 Tax=Anoxybacterium hadale TaxID=3408580 RepID=A0ACD1A9E7_9FIRM|nr:prepilin-type N-terminal cleavage/methylation domain-containing protein [Clostridiales bacterium]